LLRRQLLRPSSASRSPLKPPRPCSRSSRGARSDKT
jgi:hypothetical protein